MKDRVKEIADKCIFRAADLCVPVGGLLLAGVVCALLFFLPQPPKKQAEVTVYGTRVALLPLDTDAVWEWDDGGKNRLEIRDGTAKVVFADCDTQVCVGHRAVSRVGESIVCAPHGLVITVIGAAEDGPDLTVR